MKITVFGSGVVGQALASKFSQLGHEVVMATRDPEATSQRTEPNPQSGISFASWHAKNQEVQLVAFDEVSGNQNLYVNATGGVYSLEILKSAGAGTLSGNILLDVANPLDFSQGWPPSLAICNTDSLGEKIQREFPDCRVVKCLNTLNYQVMVAPDMVPGDHQVFMSGEDAKAKEMVAGLLSEIGWDRERVIDLGGIRTARGTEMMMPMWLGLMGVFGSPIMNFEIRRP